MDKGDLKTAAKRGDVEFLRKCVAANKPHQYYLTLFPQINRYDQWNQWCGNMFHIAAVEEQEEFIREAIEGQLLGVELVQQLLRQSRSGEGIYKENPLHIVARRGNVKILKMFLSAFTIKENEEVGESSSVCIDRIPPYNNHPPPWLLTNEVRETPCHVALMWKKEECGLEILRMDMESLSNMLDDNGNSLLYLAVIRGLDEVAKEIVTSPHSFSASGPNGENALHRVSNCSSSEKGKGICRLLFKKMPKLIEQKVEDRFSILNNWAYYGKIWPFECLLESRDTIPNVGKIFVELISATNNNGANLLHHLPHYSTTTSNNEYAQIGKLLIDTYKQEEANALFNLSTGELHPWLVQDDRKKTPLDYAMDKGKEEIAQLILSEDKNALKTCQKDVLFVAIEKRFHEVSLKILEIVDEKGLTHLLTNDQNLNALHLAPKCTRDFCERLLKHHPDLIGGVDKEGETILHKWVKIGQVWPFQYLLNDVLRRRSNFVDLMNSRDEINGNNPLHVAATCTNESTLQIVKLLVQAFQDKYQHGKMPSDKECLPWYAKNENDEGALHVAIRCQKDQKLALYLLSLHQNEDEYSMTKLLDYCAPNEHKILFLAMEKLFPEVIKTILARIDKARWKKYLKDDFSTGNNILHHASSTITNNKTAGEKLIRWLVEEIPELITDPNMSGIAPVYKASEVGASWIIEVMLQKDPSPAFNQKPFAWVKACENGHLSVIRILIKYCPENFGNYCIYHQDTPLHHIKLRNSVEHEEFFKIPYMKDLINVQDSQKATPLHKAIKNKNILLAEALLSVDKIRYDIKDARDKTATDLLAKVYKKQPTQWGHVYKSIEPILATSYFRRETDLLEVRNTLSVVAALLATITFTAGFTLPGGLNQDSGEAILANKAAFLVFIISNTMAMCLSMVVLICLIWSMVFERNRSIYLIDRSLRLLIASIYMTLLAFVSGVYVVISPKSLWAALLIVVMCSVVGMSANRTLLYRIFTLTDKLLSFVNKKCTHPINCMELGLCQCGESSHLHPDIYVPPEILNFFNVTEHRRPEFRRRERTRCVLC